MTIQSRGKTELLVWMLVGTHGLTMVALGFLIGKVARYHASTTDFVSQSLGHSEHLMIVFLLVGTLLMGVSSGAIFGPQIRDFVGHVVSGDD